MNKHITNHLFSLLIVSGLIVTMGHPLTHTFESLNSSKNTGHHPYPADGARDGSKEECPECILISLTLFEVEGQSFLLFPDSSDFLMVDPRSLTEVSSYKLYGRAPPFFSP